MIRRRARPQFHEPSLVPMADMLTNTVGVVLFILIFTVLTAGAAVVTRRLPMERSTKATAVTFLCASGRIISMADLDAPIKEFLRPLLKDGKPVDDFVTRFQSRRLETDYLILTGDVQGEVAILVQPKPGSSESSADLADSISKFRTILAGLDPREKYARFLIYPSGVTAFRSARDIASSGTFGTGWDLFGASEPIRDCIGYCGPGGSGGTIK